MTFWPPAVVEIEEPSGMTPLASSKAFLGAISSMGSVEAGRLPFIFLYSFGSWVTLLPPVAPLTKGGTCSFFSRREASNPDFSTAVF